MIISMIFVVSFDILTNTPCGLGSSTYPQVSHYYEHGAIDSFSRLPGKVAESSLSDASAFLPNDRKSQSLCFRYNPTSDFRQLR